MGSRDSDYFAASANMAVIRTDRLVLRRLQPSDAQDFHEIVGDPEVMRHWYPGADANLEATCAGIAEIDAHWQRHGLGDLGIEAASTGQPLAGLHYISNMPEVLGSQASARLANPAGSVIPVSRQPRSVGATSPHSSLRP